MENQDRDLTVCLLTRKNPIRTALSIIDERRTGSVLVIDEDGRLEGCVTEQEIRRSLLAGATLDIPVEQLMTKPMATVAPSVGRPEVLDLMQALHLREVPIVDSSGRVCGIHFEDEIIGTPQLESWAVIMAGGRGTRLAPLTDNIPKPMLPIAGRPILERLVLHLVGSGVRKIFLSVNYLAEVIEKHFGDGSKFGCDIEYLREEIDRPLGTGGPLRLLEDLGYEATAPLIVLNGDLVTAFSVQDLLDAHRARGAVATISVSEYQHHVPFGVLEPRDGYLQRIVEKPTHSWFVNGGIYVVEPQLIERVPPGRMFPITALFDDCLKRGELVGLWDIRDDWQDIGRPAELARAQGHT
ncbi:nucleotidyltransferase family protein [Amycolatopsis acidiphila]|uniref:nucleotidyltransferase family protein n=1 Tax=Amycolatopsis acidiphila TaxID=715473 RepID=UPI001643AD35|nr:nucleotidyltransferase family protein [Amycolatopsis acidiphila]UIJ60412.1 nucleotidyltransferase family protein [Amycolatopsis acidiphila]